MTVCVSVPVEPAKSALPGYAAVMGWVPTFSGTLTAVVALPLTRGELTEERLAMVKVTLPVAVPAPGATGVTVAVRVKGCPGRDGSGEETSVVVVSARLTVCGSVPLEPAKLVLPV